MKNQGFSSYSEHFWRILRRKMSQKIPRNHQTSNIQKLIFICSPQVPDISYAIAPELLDILENVRGKKSEMPASIKFRKCLHFRMLEMYVMYYKTMLFRVSLANDTQNMDFHMLAPSTGPFLRHSHRAPWHFRKGPVSKN